MHKVKVLNKVVATNVRKDSLGYAMFDVTLLMSGSMNYLESELFPSGVPDDYRGTDVAGTGVYEVFISEALIEEIAYAYNGDTSFRGKPFTNDHPNHTVTAADFTKVAKGVVMSTWSASSKLDGTVQVFDADTITNIENGKTEVSTSYSAEVHIVDGRIHVKQIFPDHLALVDAGRCGSTCSINNQIHNGVPKMPVVKIGAVEIEVADANTAALLNSAANTMKANNDALQARVDAAEAEKARLTADLQNAAKAGNEAEIEKRALERARLINMLPAGFDATGKTACDLKKAVITAAYPTIDLANKSPDYVNALIDTIPQKATSASSTQGVFATNSNTAQQAEQGMTHEQAVWNARYGKKEA